MELSEFTSGASYRVKLRDFVPPDGSPPVKGVTKDILILPPATAENSSVFDGESHQKPTDFETKSWGDFLRVKNIQTDKIHLLHPETIESAAALL